MQVTNISCCIKESLWLIKLQDGLNESIVHIPKAEKHLENPTGAAAPAVATIKAR